MHTPPTMPGAFNFSYFPNTNHNSKDTPPRLSGANSHIYRPPRTPSVSASSSLILTRSANSNQSDYQQISAQGRKRTRVDFNDGRNTPEPRREDEPGSPLPFVNTMYALKGGMDTPTMEAERLSDSVGDFMDQGYRKDSGLLGEKTGSYQSFRPLDLDLDSSDGTRHNTSRSNGSSGDGWSKTALGVVGGVVGKVWEFCKKGAFIGFHAGAGNGYTVTDDGAMFRADATNGWVSEKVTTNWGTELDSTPLPGRFPDEAFIADYWDSPTQESTPPRAGKRRHIGDSHDELGKNWVVVNPARTDEVATPTRLQSRASTGPARYSMPTASSASRRSRPAPASRAGLGISTTARRPVLPRVSHAGPPTLQASQPASFASPRSPHGSRIPRAVNSPSRTVPKIDSPAAKEAQKWAAVKKREEQEADITMRRMDKQLKDLIRQGKEALGTKIEVEIEDDYTPSTPRRGNNKKWGV